MVDRESAGQAEPEPTDSGEQRHEKLDSSRERLQQVSARIEERYRQVSDEVRRGAEKATQEVRRRAEGARESGVDGEALGTQVIPSVGSGAYGSVHTEEDLLEALDRQSQRAIQVIDWHSGIRTST